MEDIAEEIAGSLNEWNSRTLTVGEVSVLWPVDPEQQQTFRVPSFRATANQELHSRITAFSLPIGNTLYAADMEVRKNPSNSQSFSVQSN